MESIDWQIIGASFAFTLSVFLTWVLVVLLKKNREINDRDRRIQELLDNK